jgi:DNA-binding CsgD family transcriptional regulator
MSLLSAISGFVRGAVTGLALRADGGTEELPGLVGHPLLGIGSPALAVARAQIDAGRVYASFLWPLGGRRAAGGHARLPALIRPEQAPAALSGLVVVSPRGDLWGLTPRELEVLGLLIEGRTAGEIARALLLVPRTGAAHLRHILGKLSSPTPTLAALRAERDGLYVPARIGTPPPRPKPASRHDTNGKT